MTPAITIAKRQKLNYQLHEYQHEPNSISYGLEASEKMGIEPNKVFKTLVVMDENKQLAVAILPVDKMLNLKKMAKAIVVKKVIMADPKIVEKTTGYVLGGVSPLGQKKKLTTIINISAEIQQKIYVSAGKRGLQIELDPAELKQSLSAQYIDIIQES